MLSVPDFIALISGITGVVTAIGVLIANLQQNKKTAALLDYRMMKTEEKLEKVDKKLDEHNGYAKMFATLEKMIVAIQKDIEYLKQK